MKMRSETFNKLLLVFEVALCALWIVCMGHCYPFKSLFLLIPIVRIWLAFLTYRKSQMAICPMMMFAILNLVVLCMGYNGAYDLYVAPTAKFFNSVGALFGWQLDAVLEYLQSYADGKASFAILFYGAVSMLLLPFLLYAYRRSRKSLVPSILGTTTSRLLCLYLFAVICLIEAFVPIQISISVSVAIIVPALALIPILFYKGQAFQIMSRKERVILLTLAIFAWGYVCGLGLEHKAIFNIMLLPLLFYILVNWYYSRRVTCWEIFWVMLGAGAFWTSQYTTDTYRILLLTLSLLFIIIALSFFVRATKKWIISVATFTIVGLCLPVLCMGYNPYSVLHASRFSICRDYLWSPYGLLYVEREGCRGIRDRYGIVLPAEFETIEILDPSLPYFKVCKKGEGWQIFDIERQQFATDEVLYEIFPYKDNGTFFVHTDLGNGFLILPDYYTKHGERATPEKLLMIKREYNPAFFQRAKDNYYHRY